MKLTETKINMGGMLRCCIDTINTLDESIDYQNKIIIDCKHEKPGNQSIILLDGIWQWNQNGRKEILKTLDK